MHILFVSHSFPPADRPLANVGGMQRVATELHRALRAQEGLKVSDVVLRSTWQWTHVRIIPYMLRVLVRLFRASRKGNYDVILFSSMVTAALAIPFRRTLRRAGIRTAVIVHGRDVTLPVRIYQMLVPFIFRAMDLVLPISDAVRSACQERGATTLRLFRVPNGVDTSRFETLHEAEDARQRLRALLPVGRSIPHDALVLCSVGRQVRRKGFAWFVEHVLPRLPGTVHYVLAGDGPERVSIREASERAGVAHRVALLGRVSEDDLAVVYRGSHLFVMPNVPVDGDMEGFGVVMLEAGLNELPTIAARIDGIRDVIASGQNGHLIEPMNPAEFAETIVAYAADMQTLDRARARAREHVRMHFDWSTIARQYVQALGLLVPADRQPSTMPAHAMDEHYQSAPVTAAA